LAIDFRIRSTLHSKNYSDSSYYYPDLIYSDQAAVVDDCDAVDIELAVDTFDDVGKRSLFV
jgi:hypothetical protein